MEWKASKCSHSDRVSPRERIFFYNKVIYKSFQIDDSQNVIKIFDITDIKIFH